MGGRLPAIIALFALAGVVAVFGLQQYSSISSLSLAEEAVLPGATYSLTAQETSPENRPVQHTGAENILKNGALKDEAAFHAPKPVIDYENDEPFPEGQATKENLLALGRRQRLRKAVENGTLNDFLTAEEEREHKKTERERLRRERIQYVREQQRLRHERLQAYRERVRAGEDVEHPGLAPMAVPEGLRREDWETHYTQEEKNKG